MLQEEFAKWKMLNVLNYAEERQHFSQFFEAYRKDCDDVIEEIAWQLCSIQQNEDCLEENF